MAVGICSLLVFGCGYDMIEQSRIVSVDNTLLSYRHRSDLLWGAVPVCPVESSGVAVLANLQVGGAANENMVGSGAEWVSEPWQATSELQILPGWVLARWPGGYRAESTIDGDTARWRGEPADESDRTYRESHEASVTLVGIGTGWTRRYGSNALTVGGRASVRRLYQVEGLAQFTAEF